MSFLKNVVAIFIILRDLALAIAIYKIFLNSGSRTVSAAKKKKNTDKFNIMDSVKTKCITSLI